MLSVFPELFDFYLISATLLRITAGGFLFVYGLRLLVHAAKARQASRGSRIIGIVFGVLQGSAGGLLTVGLFTQPAALVGALLSLVAFETSVLRKSGKSSQPVQLLLCIICISILFLGPGVLSVDLPI